MDPITLKQVVLPLGGMLIGLASLAIPVLIVYFVLQHRRERDERLIAAAKHFAERGLPLPPELFSPPPPKSEDNALVRAYSLLGIGLGLALMFYTFGRPGLMGIGGLLFCIGVAQLIGLHMAARQKKPVD